MYIISFNIPISDFTEIVVGSYVNLVLETDQFSDFFDQIDTITFELYAFAVFVVDLYHKRILLKRFIDYYVDEHGATEKRNTTERLIKDKLMIYNRAIPMDINRRVTFIIRFVNRLCNCMTNYSKGKIMYLPNVFFFQV